MREQTLQAITRHKLVAIIRGIPHRQALSTVEALYEGGVRLVEIPFDHRSAEGLRNTRESIETITRRFGTELAIGAGTVLLPEQVEQAEGAGASFILSPDTSQAVIERTRELGLVSVPGGATPTEISRAYRLGADLVKLFPAADLGLRYLQAVGAPLGHIPLLAVGGIDEHNMQAWLQAGAIGVGVGGSLVREELIREERYSELTALARAYTSQIV